MKNIFISLLILLIISGCAKDENNLENNLNEPSIVGTYIETYTDKIPSDWKRKDDKYLSTLIFNEDGTCIFTYNNCDAMYSINLNYKIEDDKVILYSETNDNSFKEFKDKIFNEQSETVDNITFTIISNDELYFDHELSCVYGYDAYQKGYASFKKLIVTE